MAERFRLAPVMTASSWSTLSSTLWSSAQRMRGLVRDSQGTVAPKLTNREASAVIAALRALAPMTRDGWSIWYLLAAAAYGWMQQGDAFVVSPPQADRMYPPNASVQLWLASQRILADLAEQRPDVPPRIDLDDVFDDVTWRGDVLTALKQDGARVDTQVKHPVPGCRDRKTGKVRAPRPRCPEGKDHIVDPMTRAKLPCDKPGDCEPLTVDDPVTAVGSSLVRLLLMVGAAYALFRLSTTARSRATRWR